MRKLVSVLVVILFFAPIIVYATDKDHGQPFQYLRNLINQMRLTPGPQGPVAVRRGLEDRLCELLPEVNEING
jgi:hypothetical protein